MRFSLNEKKQAQLKLQARQHRACLTDLDEANNFKTYDRPDSSAMVLTSTNGKGEVAGYFLGNDGKTHGLLGDAAGNSRAIDVAGSNHTEFWGLNNQGQLVGWYTAPDGNSTRTVGFVRESNASIVEIALGDGPTHVRDVNELGEVVGSFSDASGTHGFLGTPSK